MIKQKVGAFGESEAEKAYKKRGYKLVVFIKQKTAYEIDLILKNKKYIVFCEVKTRKTSFFGTPAECVNIKKQSNIIECAQYYLMENETKLQPRFDVVEVIYEEKEGKFAVTSLNIIEGAFEKI